jgi:hypothetical protein
MTKIKITRQQFEKLKFAYRIFMFSLTLAILVAFSILIKKPIEFVFIFLPYFATKGLYSYQWHSDSLKECFILSIGLFALSLCITLPTSFSMVFSLFVGLMLAYLSCKAGIIKFKLKDYAFIEPRYNQLVDWYNEANKPKEFNTATCTLEELLNRCKELRLSQENTTLAVEFFINKTKQSKIADILCIDETSVAIKKFRLKQKLNKNL